MRINLFLAAVSAFALASAAHAQLIVPGASGGSGCSTTCTNTGPLTITNGTANTPGLTLGGGAITGSSTATPGISITGNLGTSANPDGAAIFANITGTGFTGSVFSAKLFDFQYAGASVFSCQLGGTCATSGSFSTGASATVSAGNFATNAGVALIYSTAPTVTSGGTLATKNGPGAFTVTANAVASIVIGLPTSTNGWVCGATDNTTVSTSVFVQKVVTTSNSATITNYNTAGSATAFVASDAIKVSCLAD